LRGERSAREGLVISRAGKEELRTRKTSQAKPSEGESVAREEEWRAREKRN
jgi:hypothetical protein